MAGAIASMRTGGDRAHACRVITVATELASWRVAALFHRSLTSNLVLLGRAFLL